MKKLLISECQLEIYLRDNPLGTTEATQAKKGLEEAVTNLKKLVSQDKLGKVLYMFFVQEHAGKEDLSKGY